MKWTEICKTDRLPNLMAKYEIIVKNHVPVKSFRNWFLTWHCLTVLSIIRKEEYDGVFRRMISSIKDHLLAQCSLDRLVKWGLNAQYTCTSECSHSFRNKECRKYDPCGEVYLGTGREFGEGLMFIADYPLDTDMQCNIEVIGQYRSIDLWAEKYQEVTGKVLPSSSAR